MRPRVAVVEFRRASRESCRLLDLRLALSGAPTEITRHQHHERQHAVCRRIVGVALDRLLESCNRGFALGLGQPPEQGVCLNHRLPSAEILRRAGLRADTLGLQELRLDCSDNLPGDFVLQGEDVCQIAVVAVGPDVVIRRGIDQLRGNAHTITALAHAALQHVAHAQFAGDALNVDRLALVGERRIARDDEEPAQLRQTSDDVLGNAVGEIFLLGVATHIGERQHGDRGPIGT